MIISLIITVIIFLVAAFVLLAFAGKRLQLFSQEMLNESGFLRLAPLRMLMYFASGLVWSLGKIRFPGTESIVTYSFDNKIGRVLRAAYWKSRVASLGKNVFIDVGAKAIGWQNISIGDYSAIDRNVILETGVIDKNHFLVYVKKSAPNLKDGELRIGKGCHISKNVVIQSFGGVFIGDFSGVASGAKIYSLSHHYKNPLCDDGIIYKFSPFAPTKEQSLIQGSVVLEGNNAVGLNSVVLPGVTIGQNSWVGVCSYVTQDVPPNCLALGSPAKTVKKIRETSDKT